jgi:ankyrin repeat protein
MCFTGRQWEQVRQYLSSTTISTEKKKEALISKRTYGFTCLHSACTKSSSAPGGELMFAPADVIHLMIQIGGMDLLMTREDYCGYTPLHALAYNQNTSVEVMELLLILGGKKELIFMNNHEFGYTMLHELCIAASKWETLEDALARISLLIKYGGKDLLFAKTEKRGRNALHLACMERAPLDVVKLLLTAGGKELALSKDNDGMTALHYQCIDLEEDPHAILKIILLLEYGGDDLIAEKTGKDKTAFDIAQDEGAPSEVLEALFCQGGIDFKDAACANFVPYK